MTRITPEEAFLEFQNHIKRILKLKSAFFLPYQKRYLMKLKICCGGNLRYLDYRKKSLTCLRSKRSTQKKNYRLLN